MNEVIDDSDKMIVEDLDKMEEESIDQRMLSDGNSMTINITKYPKPASDAEVGRFHYFI